MSAESALERFTSRRRARSIQLTLADTTRPDDTSENPDPPGYGGAERRSQDPVATLSRQFDALCTRAVDPAEIAAGLEANGFTDGSVRTRYGLPDVFTLAGRLYDMTPRALRGPKTVMRNPWRSDAQRHVLRGLTFSTPGLLYLVALPATKTAWQHALLILALVVGWGLGQSMAYLGSLFYGADERPHAAAWLRVGLFVALLASLGVGFGAWRVGGAQLGALAAGNLLYLACAAVVLVLADEVLVLCALVPGLLVAATAMLAPVNTRAMAGVASLVTLSIVAVIASALVLRRPLVWSLPRLRPRERAEVLWHLSYGVVAGVLVSVPTIIWGADAASGAALLPLIWSMGFAEWRLLEFRRRAFDVATDVIQLDTFARRMRVLALQGVGIYVVCLTLLTALVVGVTWSVPAWIQLRPAIASVAAAWLLGTAFYLALLAASLGNIRAPVAAMAAGTVLPLAAIALLPVWFPEVGVVTPPIAAAAVVAGPVLAILCLAWPCDRAITNPTCHL